VPVLIARLQKYVEYTRAFHLLERSFFCEGGTNKKTHFSRARSLLLHGPETTHDHPQTKTNMYLPKNLIDI